MKNKVSFPEWFNLKLYEEAKDFSPLDWLTIINSRLSDLATAKAKNNGEECYTGMLYQHLDLLREGKLGSYIATARHSDQAVSIARKIINTPTIKTLKIDIAAPKNLIKEQFENWLNEEKKETKFNKAFSKKEVEKLIDNRILPILDIAIYEAIENISYTNVQLADLLFPDEYDIDRVEKVRNAKRLLWDNIASKEYKDWLYSQRWVAQSNLNR